ncbi:major tail protein [Mycobacterium phage Konstantine]|uniref:Major tail subunit n=1 Tax=Mycobacterium phage Konstantine TaxID=563121 RepID=B5U4Z8_9CAUD|nr:major tail protein [Mycobacterium phage Konstantine]ACI12444.1 major tail subunit [Mycobacterium phage Konstantine]
MTAPVADALPYGVRDCKLTEYIDAAGNVLGNTSVDLPYMQTLSFSESEEFQELRGDDKLITTRGQGAQVDWDLEAGGMSTPVWAILTGGDVIESGVSPNRVIELRKKATQSRPFFRIDGKIISDSGGDILVRIYRCRCNDTIDADFSDGEFMTTAVSGVGLPLLDDTNDLLYSIFRRETSTALTLTPEPNPVQSPLNLTAGTVATTSVALTWTPVAGATKYGVYYKLDEATSYTKFETEPTAANVSLTGLTADKLYNVHVTAFVNSVESDPCPDINVETPAS